MLVPARPLVARYATSYAVQRLANGQWFVRTLMGNPIMPAVNVIAVVGAPTSAAPRGTFFNSCSITGALCQRGMRSLAGQ
jgi:hypothetical protein